MPTFEFNSATMPTPEEFAKMLREASEQYDPVEELLRLERELITLEQKYGLSSAEFYNQYQSGKLGDAMDFIQWAGLYRLHSRLKKLISNSLDVVVTTGRAVIT
ncbi:MAG TPA: hypothetical protein VF177_15385 [Anaerolineae bacterium]